MRAVRRHSDRVPSQPLEGRSRGFRAAGADHAQRGGVVTLELIIWLPVLVISVLAIIELGTIYAVNEQVAHASRYGAKIASETQRATGGTNLSNLVSSGALTTLIEQNLRAAGINNGPCQVILEHNACVANPLQLFPASAPANCNCTVPSNPQLPGGFATSPRREYVRITVCVPLSGNVPDLLSSFGFPITGRTLQHSTLFRIEPDNATAQPTVTATAVTGTDAGDTVTGVGTPNSNINIVINDPVASAQVTVTFTATATDPEDGPLTGASIVWSSVAAAPVSLSPTTGNGPVSLVIDVPATNNPRTTVTYIVRVTTTDSCGDTAFRDITVQISGPLA